MENAASSSAFITLIFMPLCLQATRQVMKDIDLFLGTSAPVWLFTSCSSLSFIAWDYSCACDSFIPLWYVFGFDNAKMCSKKKSLWSVAFGSALGFMVRVMSGSSFDFVFQSWSNNLASWTIKFYVSCYLAFAVVLTVRPEWDFTEGLRFFPQVPGSFLAIFFCVGGRAGYPWSCRSN